MLGDGQADHDLVDDAVFEDSAQVPGGTEHGPSKTSVGGRRARAVFGQEPLDSVAELGPIRKATSEGDSLLIRADKENVPAVLTRAAQAPQHVPQQHPCAETEDDAR